MPEMTARAPEPDTSRVPRRSGESQPPQSASPRVSEATQRALDAVAARGGLQPPAPEPPPDPEVEMAKPLDAMPKWEAEHTFTLSHPVQRPDGSQVHEVRLRGPNGLDMFEVGGLPTKTKWEPSGMTVEMDPERLKKWIGKLAIGVDAPTVFRAPARDIRAMFEWLNTELQQAGN